ncbi:Lissencephaly-1 [Saitoella coloradoensis]
MATNGSAAAYNPPPSVLGAKQRTDLHLSLLAYLQSQGFERAYTALRDDLQEKGCLDGGIEDGKKYVGLLERKWSSVVRLQKKNMELEGKLNSLSLDLKSTTSSPGPNGTTTVSTIPLPRTSTLRHTLTSHRDQINSCAFHPKYTLLLTASDDTTVKLWDHDAGSLEQTLRGHTKSVLALDWSEDGKRAISAGADTLVKVWEDEGKGNGWACVRTLVGHEHSVHAVKFLPGNDGRAISGGRDSTVRVWDTATGFCLKTIIIGGGNEWIRSISPSTPPTTAGAAWNNLVAVAGNDQMARIIDVGSTDTTPKSELVGRHSHVIEAVAYAPATASSYLHALAKIPKSTPTAFLASASRDRSITITTSTNIPVLTLNGHDNWVRAVSWHPSGRYLLSASDDRSVRVWDLEQEGRCVRVLDDAQNGFVNCLAGDKEGKVWATGGAEGEARVWGTA